MKKALIIGKVWPEPESSAAGRHMLEIMQALLNADWQITFATAAVDERFSADLQSLSVVTAQIAVNDDAFDQWLMDLNPQLVIFDRFMTEEQFGWRVARHCPEAIRVLDSEDLHCLREYRQHQTTQKLGDTAIDYQQLLDSRLALREIASIYRSDLTLIISEAEIQLLKQALAFDEALLHYFPFISDGARQSAFNAFANRQGFVFVGTMMHKPNQQAVRLLKKSIWPKIRQQLPDASLKIIGSYMPEEFLQMHKPAEGFEVLGRVESLTDILSTSRVHLAPLSFGAGLKGKLLEAMEYGLVSVTTAVGAEGIVEPALWPGRVVDDEMQMVSAAVELHQQEKLWTSCQQRGFDILQQRFSRLHSIQLLNRIDKLSAELELHRQNNFTGRMLQHHFHASTEYMSRWITAKNL